ncbi:MAG: 3-hydroxyacyl-CoA dehydrogenase family protein [Solirubrobacteraceae bacterium]
MSVAEIEKVAVVGAGFMGAGIAECVAVAGIPVVATDVDDVGIERAWRQISASMKRAVKTGKYDDAVADAARARIELTTDIGRVAGANLVIEAVPELEEFKTQALNAVDALVGPEAIIASNTSSMAIAKLAGQVSNPERVVGLHFFSPVPVMGLVEVVQALDTSSETIATSKAFVEKLGKVPVQTKDRCGFVVNLLLVPYLMAAVRMLEQDFASREDIDAGMKLGCGHPMGPLTLCDFIGLDILHAVCESLFEEFKRPEYAPPPLLKRMIASGRLGRKSGRGFYEYS